MPARERPARERRNLSPAALYEHAIRRNEGRLSDRGALVTTTGKHTGRAPKDRFLVVDPAEHARIDWGAVNQEMNADTFDRLLGRVQPRPRWIATAGQSGFSGKHLH